MQSIYLSFILSIQQLTSSSKKQVENNIRLLRLHGLPYKISEKTKEKPQQKQMVASESNQTIYLPGVNINFFKNNLHLFSFQFHNKQPFCSNDLEFQGVPTTDEQEVIKSNRSGQFRQYNRQLRGAAEHFIDGSGKSICWLSFEFWSPPVIEIRSNCKMTKMKLRICVWCLLVAVHQTIGFMLIEPTHVQFSYHRNCSRQQ